MRGAALLGAAVFVLFFGFLGTVLLAQYIAPTGVLVPLLMVAGGWGVTAALTAYLIEKSAK